MRSEKRGGDTLEWLFLIWTAGKLEKDKKIIIKSTLKLESLKFFHVSSVCEIPLTLSLNEVTKKTNTIDGQGAACMAKHHKSIVRESAQ